MNYTIAEKILLAHISKSNIRPGEFIEAKIDLGLGNDITAPLAIEGFKKAGFDKVFDRNKIALIPDHFAPAKDLKSANQCKILAEFAKEQKIKNYFEIGCMGIEHVLLPERAIVLPGDLVIGADSHTCTYGALGCYSTGVGSTDLARAFADGKVWLKVPASVKFVYKGKLNKWVGGKDLILFTIGDIGVDGALYKSMEFTGEVISRLPMDDRFAMCNMAIEAGARAGLIEPDEITKAYVKERIKLANHKPKYYISDKDAVYEKMDESINAVFQNEKDNQSTLSSDYKSVSHIVRFNKDTENMVKGWGGKLNSEKEIPINEFYELLKDSMVYDTMAKK